MIPWILCAVLYTLGMVVFAAWVTDDFQGCSDKVKLTVASSIWPIAITVPMVLTVYHFLKGKVT